MKKKPNKKRFEVNHATWLKRRDKMRRLGCHRILLIRWCDDAGGYIWKIVSHSEYKGYYGRCELFKFWLGVDRENDCYPTRRHLISYITKMYSISHYVSPNGRKIKVNGAREIPRHSVSCVFTCPDLSTF